MSKTSFAPPPRFLLAMAAQNLGWARSLAELADNAIDKNATRIEIFEGPVVDRRLKWFKIVDNGDGCPEPRLICHYGSRGDDDAGLGRFGVGGPDAIMDIGGLDATVSIESVFKGIPRFVRMQWRQLLKTDDWALDDATWVGRANDKRGTTILIEPVRRAPITKPVLRQLGYWFAPYLKDGQFIFHRHNGETIALERWELPSLEDVIDCKINVGGKAARIHVGVVPEGKRNERAGITIAHIHRVIEEASGSCCGEYGYERICGVVMLDRSWDLNKNKDGLNDETDALELYAAVHGAIEPTLAKGRQRYETFDNQAWSELLESEANRQLFRIGEGRSDVNDAKAKRSPGDRKGTVQPTGTGGKHRRATVEQPGDTFPGRRSVRAATRKSMGLKIQLGDFPEDDLRPGKFDQSGYVTLNSSHTRVLEYWNNRNLDGTMGIVAAIVANDEAWARGTTLSMDGVADDGPPQERFLQRFGVYLANKRVADDGSSAH